jgi:hypothetical protein
MIEKSFHQIMGSLDEIWTSFNGEEVFNNNPWSLLFIATVIALRIYASFQRERVQLIFKKSSPFLKAVLQETKIRDMWYKPYFLVLNGHLHCIVYLIVEAYNKYFFDIKYERELFEMSDGG